MPGQGEDTIDALRQRRLPFRHRYRWSSRAPDIRVLTGRRRARNARARRSSPRARKRPTPSPSLATDHIAVHGASDHRAARRRACRAAAHLHRRGQVPSVLVGLLLALNSDALLTLPASLASISRSSSGSPACRRLSAHTLPVAAPLAFELRPRRVPRLGARRRSPSLPARWRSRAESLAARSVGWPFLAAWPRCSRLFLLRVAIGVEPRAIERNLVVTVEGEDETLTLEEAMAALNIPRSASR